MKKKSANTCPKFSIESYIKTKARTLPLGKCYISRPNIQLPTSIVFVTRVHPTGNLTIGAFFIDNYGKGMLESLYFFNNPEENLSELLAKFQFAGKMTESSYVEAHNKVYEAVAFGEDAGFKPKKEWNVAQYILEEDDESIPMIDANYGWKGVHLFMAYDDEEAEKIDDIVCEHLPQEEKCD